MGSVWEDLTGDPLLVDGQGLRVTLPTSNHSAPDQHTRWTRIVGGVVCETPS